jgi:AAA+ superfamily predicted ATPase
MDYAKGVPCVMLLDEIDAMAKRRDDTQEVGELKRLVTVLLQEIDDWPSGGLLIAATNHSELLDSAVWRRFEMQITFPMPNSAAIRQAVTEFMGNEVDLSEAWLDVLAESLPGKSFNDIERELMLVRRQAVVEARRLDELLPEVVRQYVKQMSKSTRRLIAAKLAATGIPQRQINELTGVSRDTIRKSLHANGEDYASLAGA